MAAHLGVTELTEYLVVLCAHLGWAGEYLVAHLGVTELSEYLLVLCAHLGWAGEYLVAPLGVTELSEYLVVLCAHLQTQRINVALAADLILNWLLNVYDQSVIRPVALCCDLLVTTRVSL